MYCLVRTMCCCMELHCVRVKAKPGSTRFFFQQIKKYSFIYTLETHYTSVFGLNSPADYTPPPPPATSHLLNLYQQMIKFTLVNAIMVTVYGTACMPNFTVFMRYFSLLHKFTAGCR